MGERLPFGNTWTRKLVLWLIVAQAVLAIACCLSSVYLPPLWAAICMLSIILFSGTIIAVMTLSQWECPTPDELVHRCIVLQYREIIGDEKEALLAPLFSLANEMQVETKPNQSKKHADSLHRLEANFKRLCEAAWMRTAVARHENEFAKIYSELCSIQKEMLNWHECLTGFILAEAAPADILKYVNSIGHNLLVIYRKFKGL